MLAKKCINEYKNTLHNVTGFRTKYLIEGIPFYLIRKELQLQLNTLPVEKARFLPHEKSTIKIISETKYE